MQEIVQANLQNASLIQKQWYDQNARERSFEPDDHVLVLIPTLSSKRTAQWQGPYRVMEQVGSVNYRVHMYNRRKKNRVFHINMLRKWPPIVSAFLASETEEDDTNDDIPQWNDTGGGEARIGSQLTPEQMQELRELLEVYDSLFTTLPGSTTITEHHIATGTASPVRLPPYWLPHAFRQAVKQEIYAMLAHSIIEPSRSNWASPLVPVRKKTHPCASVWTVGI